MTQVLQRYLFSFPVLNCHLGSSSHRWRVPRFALPGLVQWGRCSFLDFHKEETTSRAKKSTSCPWHEVQLSPRQPDEKMLGSWHFPLVWSLTMLNVEYSKEADCCRPNWLHIAMASGAARKPCRRSRVSIQIRRECNSSLWVGNQNEDPDVE